MTITETLLASIAEHPGRNAEELLAFNPEVIDRGDMVRRLAGLATGSQVQRAMNGNGYRYYPIGSQMPPAKTEPKPEVNVVPQQMTVVTPSMGRDKIKALVLAQPGLTAMQIGEKLPEIDSNIMLAQVLAALVKDGILGRTMDGAAYRYHGPGLAQAQRGAVTPQPSRHITPISAERAAVLGRIRPATPPEQRKSTLVNRRGKPGIELVSEAAAAHPGLPARELAEHCDAGIAKASVGGFLALALAKGLVSRSRRDGVWHWYAPDKAPPDDGSESKKQGGRGMLVRERGYKPVEKKESERAAAAGVPQAAELAKTGGNVLISGPEPSSEEFQRDLDDLVNKVKGIKPPAPFVDPTPEIKAMLEEPEAPASYTGQGFHLARLADGSLLLADYVTGNAMRVPADIARRLVAVAGVAP